MDQPRKLSTRGRVGFLTLALEKRRPLRARFGVGIKAWEKGPLYCAAGVPWVRRESSGFAEYSHELVSIAARTFSGGNSTTLKAADRNPPNMSDLREMIRVRAWNQTEMCDFFVFHCIIVKNLTHNPNPRKMKPSRIRDNDNVMC